MFLIGHGRLLDHPHVAESDSSCHQDHADTPQRRPVGCPEASVSIEHQVVESLPLITHRGRHSQGQPKTQYEKVRGDLETHCA